MNSASRSRRRRCRVGASGPRRGELRSGCCSSWLPFAKGVPTVASGRSSLPPPHRGLGAKASSGLGTGWEAAPARVAAGAAGMGERLSTASSPPEPDGAAPEPRPPGTETQPPLPTVSGRTPRPQQEDDAGPPPAEPQGQEVGDGGGAPLEEGPRSEAPSSNSCRLPLRPVSRAESEEPRDGPPPSPPPPPPIPGEEGRQEDPQPAVSPPPPSQPSVVGAGGKGTPSGNVEVDLYLLPESFSGLISGDFGTLLVLSCRVCLEEKPLKPLPCCKKPVCEACLKRYLSSQVGTALAQLSLTCPSLPFPGTAWGGGVCVMPPPPQRPSAVWSSPGGSLPCLPPRAIPSCPFFRLLRASVKSVPGL